MCFEQWSWFFFCLVLSLRTRIIIHLLNKSILGFCCLTITGQTQAKDYSMTFSFSFFFNHCPILNVSALHSPFLKQWMCFGVSPNLRGKF